MAQKKYTIGIDIGGTKMFLGLFDDHYKVISELKARTKVEEGKAYFLKTILSCIDGILGDANVDVRNVEGIGIGCPGIIDFKTGTVLSSPNIPFLKNFSLGSELKKISGLPVVVENDVNAGLYGEHQFGSAKGYANVIGVFMGTGIGGGLIFNHQIYRGATGAAGEVGHLLMDVWGPSCGCGRQGCLEAMAGRLAIASEAATLAARQKAPRLYEEVKTQVLQIKSNTLRKAIEGGDVEVEALIRRKSRLVGIAMANMVNLLNPNLIVLGGGMVEAMPHLILEEARTSLREHVMPALIRTVKVVEAKLQDYAIVMGAAKILRTNRRGF